MLAETYARYGRPPSRVRNGRRGNRASLLALLRLLRGSRRPAGRGPGGGICLYPVVDYPGWDNDRCCEVGLLSMLDQNGRRTLHAELAGEIARQGAALMHVRREEVRRHAI